MALKCLSIIHLLIYSRYADVLQFHWFQMLQHLFIDVLYSRLKRLPWKYTSSIWENASVWQLWSFWKGGCHPILTWCRAILTGPGPSPSCNWVYEFIHRAIYMIWTLVVTEIILCSVYCHLISQMFKYKYFWLLTSFYLQNDSFYQSFSLKNSWLAYHDSQSYNTILLQGCFSLILYL